MASKIVAPLGKIEEKAEKIGLRIWRKPSKLYFKLKIEEIF